MNTSLRARWTYDVFLSFRGKDTRRRFTGHLYSALEDAGVHAFMDDNALPRGEKISSKLVQAIEESRISIIVFSMNYANSRWCLKELEKIMEVKKMHGQLVLPVFYDVDPSDVRQQTGSFAQAFVEHEACFEEGRDRVVRWKTALTEAGDLSGWDLKNVADGDEAKLIKKIVDRVLQELKDAHLYLPPFSVGLDTRLEKVNSLLKLGSDEVLFIGICGREGIGKTTIATAVYHRFYHAFEGRSFLANVSRDSCQPNGLVSLQEQLLSDIVKHKSKKIRNIHMGVDVIRRTLFNKKVLIVLDDVRELVQIEALARVRHWFGSGSRIIITTRDECLLQELCRNGTYMVEQLDDEDALQLFSWHAFGDSHPKEEFMELSKEIASYCKEPLALELLGSFFFGRSLVEWRSTFVHLKRTGFDLLCDDKEKDELPRTANGFVDCSRLKCDSANVGHKKLIYLELLQALNREIAREESSKNHGHIGTASETRQKESQPQDPEIETSAMYPEATPSEHSGQQLQTTCPVDKSQSSIQKKARSVRDKINILGKNADVIAHGIREHGCVLWVKRTAVLLPLLQWNWGRDRANGEKMMESFEFSWSTSTGTIAAGLLFISTEKVAFWSERSVEVVSPGGESTKIHYKVKVPIRKIKAVNEAENVERPSQKYMNIVTVDDSEIWFTGFFDYQKALKHLRRAIHQE